MSGSANWLHVTPSGPDDTAYQNRAFFLQVVVRTHCPGTVPRITSGAKV
jgi:ubiquitin-protein ligase